MSLHMLTNTDHLFLLCRVPSHMSTAMEFLVQAKGFVVGLAELQPQLQEVVVATSSPRVHPVVRPAEPSFEETVLPLLYDRKDVYEDLGSKRTMLPSTRSRWGFSLMVYAGDWKVDATVVEMWTVGGIRAGYGDVRISFRPGGDLTTRSPEFLERMLRRTIQYWHPLGADATAAYFDRAVSSSTYFRVGWLTYLADPRAASVLPAGTKYEQFADGILIRLDGDTFLRDKVQIAQAIRIRDALSAAGLLAMPAIPRPGEAPGG